MLNSNAHAESSGASHGTAGSYIVGFVLSIILTAASFLIVMEHAMPASTAVLLIAALALVQVVVHLVCFLHMNASSQQKWNVMAFGFTVMTAVILIGGSIWIMHNVSMNMMSR
ncbi:MAG: cytochrome o ubiquinol oxidase subunit [Caballeronia sp.]|jgi:cytochrome o ubiquinol oxidase operon protein cyoD|nr:cytochrome o ubiquinol oxidase subunit [Caballeronia sp.]